MTFHESTSGPELANIENNAIMKGVELGRQYQEWWYKQSSGFVFTDEWNKCDWMTHQQRFEYWYKNIKHKQ